mgnify:CR=1 FL=1
MTGIYTDPEYKIIEDEEALDDKTLTTILDLFAYEMAYGDGCGGCVASPWEDMYGVQLYSYAWRKLSEIVCQEILGEGPRHDEDSCVTTCPCIQLGKEEAAKRFWKWYETWKEEHNGE